MYIYIRTSVEGVVVHCHKVMVLAYMFNHNFKVLRVPCEYV